MYQELFETVSVDDIQFDVEKLHKNTTRTHRLVISPSVVVAIASKDPDYIWNIDFNSEEGQSLLEQGSILSAGTQSFDIHDLVPVLETDSQTYYFRILPYNDQRSSAVLTAILDQKYSDYKQE